MKKITLISLAACVVITVACIDADNTESNSTPIAAIVETTAEFTAHWFDGNAEVSVYNIEQARYGEIHEGQSTMIFVTEPFSKSKHVKLDNPDDVPNDRVDVLKLNFTRKFNTGIYPYSLMTSVFSPVESVMGAIKVTTSSQEWCGHSFTQINKTNSGFQVDQKSYFESEGDQQLTIGDDLLEDNIWTQIRTNPEYLPLGEIFIVPGTQVIRFRHIPTAAVAATAKKDIEKDLTTYSIEYADRKLSIVYHTKFPHDIVSWEDSYQSGWGEQVQILTTKATRISVDRLPYWSLNHVADSTYRQKLGLRR
jgi:hypothetical protein